MGADGDRSSRSTSGSPPPGLGAADARHARRRHELPGRRVVPSGGDAVARARPRCSTEHLQRAARTWSTPCRPCDIKISGCPNGCGQHHIAGIGFQGSVRKVGGRAVPQYFVLVGGGARRPRARASAGWRRRFRPARIAEAVERLLGLYAEERTPARARRRSSAASTSRGVKRSSRDLERLTGRRGAGRLHRPGRRRGSRRKSWMANAARTRNEHQENVDDYRACRWKVAAAVSMPAVSMLFATVTSITTVSRGSDVWTSNDLDHWLLHGASSVHPGMRRRRRRPPMCRQRVEALEARIHELEQQ